MKAQRFNHKDYTTTKVVNNILRVYNKADEPNDWYNEANCLAYWLAVKYLNNMNELVSNENVAKVCGILAALSPLKSWNENKKIAELFLKDGTCKHTRAMSQKAKDILASDGKIETISDILRGSKITSFFLNILQPQQSQAVTIDRHAVSIAVGTKIVGDKLKLSINQYEFFANCYRIAGLKLGVKPLVVQSTTWVIWRELK